MNNFIFTLTLALLSTTLTAYAQENPLTISIARGEYLARVGNCVACHTTEHGLPYAGGLKMEVPMLGVIYTTNITPDKETGIGQYTFEDFDNAMRLGFAKDGHNLYPAMPYPSYAKINRQDMQSLYDYFMHGVKPVKQLQPVNEIPSWKSFRWPLTIWNFFMLDDDRYQADPNQSDVWNRGAYLTQGLGHCGACHTPRGIGMQEKALDETDSNFLAGATLDHWSASPLNGDINSGLGRWSENDIVEYLKTGKNHFGTAFGTMVEVINNSTQYMTDSDLNAIAVYLKSLPAANEADATPYTYNDQSARKLAAFDFSQTGAQTYYQYCVSCHMYDGSGHKKHMPSLAGNPTVIDPNPSSLINLTLNGSLRLVTENGVETFDMPYFRELLTDDEVADVVTFIRQSWGHKASPVSADEVATVRNGTHPIGDDVVILKMK